MKVYTISFHDQTQWEEPAFLTKERAEQYIKEKGYNSMWINIDEFEVLE